MDALHHIDGHWTDFGRRGRIESRDPATGEVLGLVADGGEPEALAAISAARKAFDLTAWRRDPRRRAAVLLEFADRLDRDRAQLAALLTAENGKLLRQSEAEVANAASMCRYNAGLARNLFGRVCGSACNRDPLSGVIGVEEGPLIPMV